MVTYEVDATVDSSVVDAYERYMREHHIADVLATGCFERAVFWKAAPGRYRVQYDASSEEDVERYLANYAARLREDFVSRFSTGITLSRDVWVAIQGWDTQSAPRR